MRANTYGGNPPSSGRSISQIYIKAENQVKFYQHENRHALSAFQTAWLIWDKQETYLCPVSEAQDQREEKMFHVGKSRQVGRGLESIFIPSAHFAD